MSNSYTPISLINLLTISQAARSLNVSIKTLRRWEEVGLIQPLRNTLNHRLYHPRDLVSLEGRKNHPLPNNQAGPTNTFTIAQAASAIGVSIKTLRRWEKAGKITCSRNRHFQRVFTKDAISTGRRLAALRDRVIINHPIPPYRYYTQATYGVGLILAFVVGLNLNHSLPRFNQPPLGSLAQINLGKYTISLTNKSTIIDATSGNRAIAANINLAHTGINPTTKPLIHLSTDAAPPTATKPFYQEYLRYQNIIKYSNINLNNTNPADSINSQNINYQQLKSITPPNPSLPSTNLNTPNQTIPPQTI